MSGGGAVTPVDAAGWRALDPETGDLVFVCPQCWPNVAAEWRARADVAVRELETRPMWARCGMCDPEGVC